MSPRPNHTTHIVRISKCSIAICHCIKYFVPSLRKPFLGLRIDCTTHLKLHGPKRYTDLSVMVISILIRHRTILYPVTLTIVFLFLFRSFVVKCIHCLHRQRVLQCMLCLYQESSNPPGFRALYSQEGKGSNHSGYGSSNPDM